MNIILLVYNRAAPSVTACAAPPSSERKAFVSHDLTCLSLWERCRAATERAGSLVRELDCRFAARLREQPTSPDESGYLLYEFASVSPSQSFASQMPALPKGEPRIRCGLFSSYAQSKLVSPSGRDVAQRQRGLAPSLRELDLPQAKTEGVLSNWQDTHEI